MRHRGRLMLVLLILASLAYGVIPTHRALGARLPVSRSWTVRQTLSFCRVHPRTRDRASSVRGYYFAFQPGAGPAAFGELLSSPTQVREVLQANSVPATIGFGISIAIPLLGSNRVRQGELRSYSWVTLTGRLSCYEGRPPAELIVRSYRYD